MTEEEKYSKLGVIASALGGQITGCILGPIVGTFGSLCVPSSLRKTNEELEDTIEKTFYNKEDSSIYGKIYDLIGSYFYIPTKLMTEATLMYKMVEDIANNIANGGDQTLTYGLLAIPNLISLGYEIMCKGLKIRITESK